MSPTSEQIADVTGSLYQAAYNHQAWQTALQALQRLFSASRICIIDGTPERRTGLASIDDPDVDAPAWWAFISDPLMLAMHAVPLGEVRRPLDLIDETAFRRGALWQDWFRPRDMYSGIVSKLPSDDGLHWTLDIQRGPRQADFGAEDKALLQMLMPHITRAGQIGRMIESAQTFGWFMDQPYGVFLVDGAARVVARNPAADILLADYAPALQLRGGYLATDRPELGRLIAATCASGPDGLPGTGGTLRLPVGLGDDLILSVAPALPAHIYGVATHRRALVTIHKPLDPALPDDFTARAGEVFGLTRAEARLAVALAKGMSLKQAAQQSGLSFSSARSYLIRIFRKTQTGQQSELLALLRTLARPSAP